MTTIGPPGLMPIQPPANTLGDSYYSEGCPPEVVLQDPFNSSCPPCGPTPQYCQPAPAEPAGMLFRERPWARGEYLLWWTSGSDTPALVTTSSAGTLLADAGVLGEPGTSVLFGNEKLNNDMRSGYRVNLGGWLLADRSLGIEGSYMALGQKSTYYRAASPGTPIVARPFYDVDAGQQDALVLAYPGHYDGSVWLSAANNFKGAEAMLRSRLFQNDYYCVDALLGYRFNRLTDDLWIHSGKEWLVGEGQITAGTTQTQYDVFKTRNNFHGGQVGTVLIWERNRWSLELLGKVALGNTQSTVWIDGATRTTTPAGLVTDASGGLLAQSTNIGRYSRNELSVIPELGATVGFEVIDGLHLTFGYTFIFWSPVIRPGDQIDTYVNPTQISPGVLVGTPMPEFTFNPTSFWAHGMNFGVEYRY